MSMHIWDKVIKNGISKICGRQPLKILNWYSLFSLGFFFYVGFLSRTFMNRRTAGEGGGPHFHPLHRHLHISQATATGCSPLSAHS